MQPGLKISISAEELSASKSRKMFSVSLRYVDSKSGHNFGRPDLTSSFYVYALCRCYENNKSPFES